MPELNFELTTKIRNQIYATIWRTVTSYDGGKLLEKSINDFQEECGEIFSSETHIHKQISEFLHKRQPEEIFDFIELIIWNMNSNVQGLWDDRIEELEEKLNRWFKESGYGFEIRNHQFERVDSEFLKEDAIKPALSLLQKHSFDGALEEFEDAIRAQRAGGTNNSIAIKKANDAFESTMKSILDRRKISYEPSDTASKLITHLQTNGLISSNMLNLSTNLIEVLKSGLPTLRNTTPGSGHGQGIGVCIIGDSYVSFAIHMAGSLIVFLIQSYEELEKGW